MAEFAEVVHFRDTRKAADMLKLDDRWNPGLWVGKSLASDEHYVGTSAGVCRCRSVWRRQEKQRWDRKKMTEMNSEPWNPVPAKDKAPHVRRVYITLERQIKHSCTKGCAACFGQAKVHSPDWTMMLHRQQLRVQANQTLRPQDRQRVAPRPFQAVAQQQLRVDPRGAAESSAAQPTSSAVRTLETEDDGSAKCHSLMPGMPILHETDVDVNVDPHKLVVLAAVSYDQGQWTQRVIDWDDKYFGAKSGTTESVRGRLRELPNIEKPEVAEPIQSQEARAQSLETVYGKWLDDAKGTPEDPDAVRSRLVATQVNTYVREDVHQSRRPESS